MTDCNSFLFVTWMRWARTRIHSEHAELYENDGWQGYVSITDSDWPCFGFRTRSGTSESPESSAEWVKHNKRSGKIVYLVTWNVCPICGELRGEPKEEAEASKVRSKIENIGWHDGSFGKRGITDAGLAYLFSVAKKYENRRPMKYRMCSLCREMSAEDRANKRAEYLFLYRSKDKGPYLETKALCRKRKPKPTTKTEYKIHAKKAIIRRCRRKQITRSEQVFFSMMLGAKKFAKIKHFRTK